MSGKHVYGLVAATILMPLLGSCVDDKGVLVITQVNVLDPGSACVIPTTKTSISLLAGTLDVAVGNPQGYFFLGAIENRLPLSTGTDPGMIAEATAANTIHIDHAHIQFHPDPRLPKLKFDASCPIDFDQPLSMMIAPGSAGGIGTPVMLPCVAQQIQDAFVNGTYPTDDAAQLYYNLDFTLVGKRAGADFHSDTYHFPIRVCFGCLQPGFPKTPNCASAKPGTDTPVGNPCVLGQDDPFLCCGTEDPDKGTVFYCPAVWTGK